MNLETTIYRQQDLNHTLKSLTNQLEAVVNKIAGEKDKEKEIAKPERLTNSILDNLYFLQEENKETLEEAERLLKRLSEATWQLEVKTGCAPVSNS